MIRRPIQHAARQNQLRNRIGSNGGTLSVPTPEMYQGDFSKWVDSKGALLQIYDPNTTVANPSGVGFTRTPFAGNQIPQNRFSAVSRQIIPFASGVTPNRAGLVPGTSAWAGRGGRGASSGL